MPKTNIVRVRDCRGSQFWVDLEACPWAAAAVTADKGRNLEPGQLWIVANADTPQPWAVIRSAKVHPANDNDPKSEIDLSLPCNWRTAERISAGRLQATPVPA